jgi:Ni/Co efflux regulator RcnB
MSAKFLLSAAFASMTAAVLAVPAQAMPFRTAPAAAITDTSSLVTTVSGHRGDQHNRVVRQDHRSGYDARRDHRPGYVVRQDYRWGYAMRDNHRLGYIARHGDQRRHSR